MNRTRKDKISGKEEYSIKSCTAAEEINKSAQTRQALSSSNHYLANNP